MCGRITLIETIFYMPDKHLTPDIAHLTQMRGDPRDLGNVLPPPSRLTP